MNTLSDPAASLLFSAPPAPPEATCSALYPGIVTARFYETWDFYTATLGFRTLAECDHYVRLVHPAGAQIAVLRQEIDHQPAELVSATDGRGFWLNLVVSDVDSEHERLSAEGVAVISLPESRPWGDRQCVLRDPNGILIYLTQPASR